VNDERPTIRELLETKLQHIDDRIEGLDRLLTQRFDAGDKAIAAAFMAARLENEKDSASLKERLASMNEWRTTYGDLTASKVNQQTFDGAMSNLRTEIADLKTRFDKSEAKAGGIGSSLTTIMSVVGLLIALSVAVFTMVHQSSATVVSPAVVPMQVPH
jgi:hypothetical protein